MQTSVDRGQLRLLRIPQSRIQDVLLVERRDVFVPEARDRHVEDVLRQNMKRLRQSSSGRFFVLHLQPRETHRRILPRAAYHREGYVTLFGRLSRCEFRGKSPEPNPGLPVGRPSLKCRATLPGHHGPITQSAPDGLLLRRRLPWQSVRPEGTHESRLRDRRPGIRS